MTMSRQDWVRPSAGRLLLLLFKRPFMKWVFEIYRVLREPLKTTPEVTARGQGCSLVIEHSAVLCDAFDSVPQYCGERQKLPGR